MKSKNFVYEIENLLYEKNKKKFFCERKKKKKIKSF